MGYVNNNNKELKKIRTLGIDQSFSHTGLVVLDPEQGIMHAEGIATLPKHKGNNFTLEERIDLILRKIMEVIHKYKIKQVSIEGLSFNSKFSASTRQLAGLFYVILYELHLNNISYQITPPNSLKKLITGSGKATKDEMFFSTKNDVIEHLCHLSNLKDRSKKFEDIIDAYHLSNLAISGIYRNIV